MYWENAYLCYHQLKVIFKKYAFACLQCTLKFWKYLKGTQSADVLSVLDTIS